MEILQTELIKNVRIMKTDIIRAALLLQAVAMSLSGCSEKHSPESQIHDHGRVTVAMSAAGDFYSPSENSINEVRGYRFSDGVLKEIMEPESSVTRGKYIFKAGERAGQIHFAANLSSAPSFSGLEAGKTSQEKFLAMTASSAQMTENGIGMTGILDLESVTGNAVDVKLGRTVARLDISSYENGVSILKVEVSGFSDEGRIFPLAGNGHTEDPGEGGDAAVMMDFSENPLAGSRRTLSYLPEQDAVLKIKASVSYKGGTMLLSKEVPLEVRRNQIYTVSVGAKGSGLSLSVNQDSWDDGGVSESAPSLKGMVDMENSDLPAAVKVSASRDTVYVPYQGAEFSLSLLAEPSAEVVIDGDVDGVEIELLPAAKSGLEKTAEAAVSSRLRMPGRKTERMHLDVYHGDMLAGRIVLVFRENPARLEGMLVLDDDGVCDFGRYADGEFGTVALPAGKILALEFPAGEDEWMKAVPVPAGENENVYRVLGGWRPNDPEADGRVQEGFLVISDADGSSRESYQVKRRNWGLPVVKMGNAWWTLYNLRGDARRFEDQVVCGSEPAGSDAIYDYLQAASDAELLELMGDQYQAGNTSGLPLSYDGSAFLYDGMKASAQDFGTLDASLSAPDGYEIPSYEDYAFFAASDDFNIGGIGSRTFVNRAGESVHVNVAEREVSFLGHEYGTMAFYEFIHDGESWVLYGLGHQWNTVPGNIAKMHLLMATHGVPGKSWAMEGYASSDRPGQNWMKFVANNNAKTRMIRCVKTPVEYIY